MTDAPDLDARANHEFLLGEFLHLLFRCAPESVLDVGCGTGQLLDACAQRGIHAFGLDQPGPRLDELIERGIDAREGTAYTLPFEDRSVDWVTMRHIPHHLEHPARAFAEALRVARHGVLIAEPHFDTSLPSQRGAFALDRWEKRLDREGGMFHAEVLDLGALLAALPSDVDAEWEVEAQRSLRLRARSIADFASRAEERVASLQDADAERATLAALVVELETLGLTWNGSLCVSVRRR